MGIMMPGFMAAPVCSSPGQPGGFAYRRAAQAFQPVPQPVSSGAPPAGCMIYGYRSMPQRDDGIYHATIAGIVADDVGHQQSLYFLQ